MSMYQRARHGMLLLIVVAVAFLWAADSGLRAAPSDRVDMGTASASADQGRTAKSATADTATAAKPATADKSAAGKPAADPKSGQQGKMAAPMMTPQEMMQRRVTPAQRKAAGERLRTAKATVRGAAAAKGAVTATDTLINLVDNGNGLVPDYFGTTPNWAVSPPLTKFIDTLPDLKGLIATADTTTYPGTDYYEIELVEYTWTFHSDLAVVPFVPTKLRGYRQTNVTTTPLPAPSYLGPVILATKGRPTRIKFTNNLPAGAAGNLFIPTDTTVMGAGSGYDIATATAGTYPQNRATLHLHGGFTPWVSDGTPHQWVTPTGEAGNLTTGVSTKPVPDMPIPAGNSMTFYWPNQQSGRLMFYHDHAYGITRLNVYAGEAAGYLLYDPLEEAALATAGVPGTTADLGHLIPLVIQDKTFVWGTAPVPCGAVVPGTGTFATDPTWCDPKRSWGQTPGSLWFPHVYMPNQNPWDFTGANAMGRWDYALWFWPPYTGLLAHDLLPNPYVNAVTAPWEPPSIPGTPNPSLVPEAFMDTPVVNGKAYPTITVDPQKYQLRILNAANDRFWNLSLWVAADKTSATTAGAVGATTLCTDNATVLPANCTEVKMVPFNSSQNVLTPFPLTWYEQGLNFMLDDRIGGVPDPGTRGPAMVQIGNEAGILPGPAVINNQPVNYTYNRKNIVVLSVQEHALLMGPAERADVIVDFSRFAGKTLILYNDAPAPIPATDMRVDYYTGGPDQTSTGGTTPTLPGFGPNTRTVMQIVVSGTSSGAVVPADNDYVDPAWLGTLSTGLAGAFATFQDPIIVPQVAYNAAYPTSPTAAWTKDVVGASVSSISNTALTFTPLGGTAARTFNMPPKAIQELFELDYGRMNATLGVELPFTNAGNQTTIPFGYIDPTTEFIDASASISAPVAADGTQIWKITHNGVDTHAIHFHLFNVQVINRVGWDGAIRLPEENERGWKETVRMNPLEDIVVALRPTTPQLPFGLPDSYRLLDVTVAPGTTSPGIDPTTGFPITVTNAVTNFGWEYVWHCHLLGHEENDMMRPIVFNAPRALAATPTMTLTMSGSSITGVTWTDGTPFDYTTGLPVATIGNPANEVGFRIERGSNLATPATIGQALANTTSMVFATAYTPPAFTNTTYRVCAYNAAGDSCATTTLYVAPAAPVLNSATASSGPLRVVLSWTPGSANQTAYQVQRAPAPGGVVGTYANVGGAVAATLTTFSDTTVVANTRYAYRVVVYSGTLTATSNVLQVTTPIPTVHVGSLTGTRFGTTGNWAASARVTVRDAGNQLVGGVVVAGFWSGSNSTGPSSCTTGTTGALLGVCTITRIVSSRTGIVTYTVSSLTKAGYTYVPGANSPNPARVTIR